jgi:putative acetyltransferase
MTTTITPELPNTPDALALISELEAYLQPLSPPEAQFGFSVEKLIAEGVPFFVIRVDGVAAGCGGIKLYEDYGELKRMYIRPQYRGLGLGKQMITHLTDYALQHGITILRLETGYNMYDAMGLYERMGFQKISAFGEYRESPYNVFYEKRTI